MPDRIAVYSRTAAYRHESIPHGVRTLRALGTEGGFAVEATEDPDDFAELLADCAVVVFLSTSGEVLTAEGQERLREHVAAGGGFVGIHSAACTEYGWPFYGDLLGARFAGHPPYQPGRLLVEDRSHPATRHLGATWQLTDEWYDFRACPRGRVEVLAGADESSYTGGGMGADHPLVWCHERFGGRVFYTGLGHAAQAFDDAAFRAHLWGGIRYAAGLDE